MFSVRTINWYHFQTNQIGWDGPFKFAKHLCLSKNFCVDVPYLHLWRQHRPSLPDLLQWRRKRYILKYIYIYHITIQKLNWSFSDVLSYKIRFTYQFNKFWLSFFRERFLHSCYYLFLINACYPFGCYNLNYPGANLLALVKVLFLSLYVHMLPCC
jgi:hypothetical protein